MRRNVLLLASTALAVLLSCAGLAMAQEGITAGRVPQEGVIPGRYVVVLEDATQDPTSVAREHARGHGAEVLHTYHNAIKGYAARIPERRLGEVRADGRVAYVEPDQTTRATAQTVPWGIDKIGAHNSSTKAGNGSGAVSSVT